MTTKRKRKKRTAFKRKCRHCPTRFLVPRPSAKQRLCDVCRLEKRQAHGKAMQAKADAAFTLPDDVVAMRTAEVHATWDEAIRRKRQGRSQEYEVPMIPEAVFSMGGA